VNAMVGVPYTEDMVANAEADARAQANPESDGVEALLARYAKTPVSNFDGDPEKLTEMDALIAYLQMLGTLVDFDSYQAEGDNLR